MLALPRNGSVARVAGPAVSGRIVRVAGRPGEVLLPNRIETLQDILAVMSGCQLTRVLEIANHVGVFTALAEGPRDLGELATATATAPEILEPLLTACCAMGLLSRDADTFECEPVAAEHLVPGKPQYLGNYISHSMEVWKRWNDMPYRFRPAHGEAAWAGPEDFILAMHNLTMTGRGASFAELVDLGGRTNLLDVGGGPGTYSAFLCRRNPDLRATIWDLPVAIGVARRCVAAQPDVRDRISFVEGDWDTDDFGSGYDALLFSNVLHGMPSDPHPKFEKARAALEPGGLLIVQDFILDDDRQGPLPAALFALYIGAFTYSGLGDALRSHGFGDVRVLTAPRETRHGVVTALRL